MRVEERKRKAKPGFVELRCTLCKQKRGPTARGVGTCRRCSNKAYGQRGRAGNKAFGRTAWAFGTDSRDAKAERAMTWTETDERPRVGHQVPLGSVTPYGRVAAAGLNQGGRYYMVMAEDGSVSVLPADVLEGR